MQPNWTLVLSILCFGREGGMVHAGMFNLETEHLSDLETESLSSLSVISESSILIESQSVNISRTALTTLDISSTFSSGTGNSFTTLHTTLTKAESLSSQQSQPSPFTLEPRPSVSTTNNHDVLSSPTFRSPRTPATRTRTNLASTFRSQSTTQEDSSSSSAVSSGTMSLFCKACGYDLKASLLTYPGESAVYSTVNVTATRLTFTYIFPSGSSSLSYSLVTNYKPTANVTTPFTKPTSIGTFAPPPTWLYSGQTLTAGTTYVVITSASATSYSKGVDSTSPTITPPPVFPTPGCKLLQVSDTLTGISAYPIHNLTAYYDAAGSALAQFYGAPQVKEEFGPNPKCTEILSQQFINESTDPGFKSSMRIPPLNTPTPHPKPNPDMPNLNPPDQPEGPQPAFQTSTYVTASVLTSDGPGTVIYAPTATEHAKPIQSAAPQQISPDQPTPYPLLAPKPFAFGPAPPLPSKFDISTPGQVTGTAVSAFAPITVGAETIVPIGGGTVVVNDQTIGPGGVGTLGNGLPVSVGASEIAVGTRTIGIINTSPTAVVLPGGVVATPIADGSGIVVEGQTLTLGGVGNLANGHSISVGPSNVVVVDGQTTTMPAPIPQPLTLGGAAVTPIPGGGVRVSGATVVPGAATIIGFNTISVAPGGTAVVVNGITTMVTPIVGQGAPLTLGENAITALPGGSVAIGGFTVARGSTITLGNGEIVAVPLTGSIVVVNGQTASLQVPKTGLVINGEAITPVAGGFVVDGTTLTPGQVLTASDGQIVSVGTSGIIAVGKSTVQITAGAAPLGSATLNLQTSMPTPSIAMQSGIRKGDAATLDARNHVKLFASVGLMLGWIAIM
jgi:hypothetical protein